MRRFLLVAVLLLVLVAAASWWRLGMAIPVTVMTVKTGSAAEVVYASGTVEPRSWAKVTSPVSKRIVEVCDCEGKTVQAGHLLVRLDDSEVRTRLRELEVQRDLAMRELERAGNLFRRSVGSEQAFDKANAELARAEASLAGMVEQANEYLITAPVDGHVLRLDASVGEIAQLGQMLAHLGNQKPLDVTAAVNEEDIPRVAVGQRVLLASEAFPKKVLEGTVDRITPMGDPVQRTYRVRISLPADTPLFIGMTVEANIVIRESTGNVVVPTLAVSDDKVFTIVNDRLATRDVRIGIRGIDSVEVLEGLRAGERIVAPPPKDAQAGMKVRAEGAGS